MKQDLQHLIIIIVLGALGVISLFKNNTELATGIVGVLGGYLGAKHIGQTQSVQTDETSVTDEKEVL